MQAPQRERSFLKALTEDWTAFFVALDEQNRILELNPAMLEATGYAAAQLAGGDDLQLLCHPEDRKRLEAAFEQMKAQARTVTIEHRILARSGGELIVEWQGRAVREGGGKLEFLFVTGRDVTLDR